jgi:flagellin
MNIVAHNLTAMNAQRMYGITEKDQKGIAEKLSSGYKINRAADDAAGLSISEKMRKQIRGLSQAVQNAQDGISMVQTADGALTEVHDMLQRGNELVIRAANGTLSASDRSDINQEIQQLKEAIDQVATNTKFNETHLFPSYGLHPAQAYVVTSNSYEFEFDQSGVSKIIHTSETPGSGTASAISTGNALTEKIAKEYVPNAVNQILDKFPSLKGQIDGYTGSDADKLKMALDIKYIDGPSGTLAYVQASFYNGTQALSSLSLAVDSDDFSADDIKNNNTSKLGKLESTIAHEMMHAVMDAATPSRMHREGGAEDYPKWFVEGTAQLTGGGFTTGWNDYLMRAVKNGADDNTVKSLLKQYTVDNRVYGHGYLAAAYLGYLAGGGSGEVTAQKIANGINTLFNRLIGNPTESLKDSVNNVLAAAGSSNTYNDIINDINGTDDGASFVKKLVTASMDGAGSVIASGGLTAKATEVLGNSTGSSPIYIDPSKITTDEPTEFGPRANLLGIQAGADNLQSNRITMRLFRMSSADLGLEEVGNTNKGTNTSTDGLSMEGARNAIDSFANAIKLVSGVRSYYGAVQNRMEHTIKNLDNVIENTTASESLMRDTDMAAGMVRYAKTNILMQAGQSMMAQSNQSNQGILSLLQ